MRPQPAPVPVLDASTVMLVRPAPAGGPLFEVYLTRRRPELVFVGGAYVFPGGKVDEEDAEAGAIARCEGLRPEAAARIMGEPEAQGLRAAAHWVAAVRELFEEAGILLAYKESEIIDPAAPGVVEWFAEWRRRLNAGEAPIGRMAEAEGIRLATDRLRYVSHWITPEGPPRRFSTRFFLALCPHGQQAEHHDQEVDESLWIPPRRALEGWAEGRFMMIPPTVMSLQRLAGFERIEELLAAFPGP
jgi:8-oxo-dGTP pyrophosphatase MutT (NUDIX family)